MAVGETSVRNNWEMFYEQIWHSSGSVFLISLEVFM